MDINPTDLLTLAQQGVAYAAPLIAGGALAKVGEDTTDQATALLGRLWGLCTRQFQGQRKAEAALSVFEDEPDDPKNQERLIQQMVVCFQGQPAAIADLAELVRQLQAVSGASHTVQHRSITVRDQAQVGAATVGDVQGNLTIGPTTFGDQVRGDKISGDISTGSVSGTGIAIGHKAQAQAQQGETKPHEDADQDG